MNQVESLKRRIGSVTDPLDIEDVREELNLKFERLKTRGKNNSNDNYDEHPLFAGGNQSRSKSVTTVASLVTSLRTVTQKERVRKPIKDRRMVLESSKVTASTAKSLDIVPQTAERKRKILKQEIKPPQQRLLQLVKTKVKLSS
jgi:hypothetical protein